MSDRPRKPILCWVTDRGLLASNPGSRRRAALQGYLQEAVDAGIDWIQLREKDLEASELLDLAREAVRIAGGASTRVLVNDRLDIAWSSNASGVHLGENSLPVLDVVKAIRPVLGAEFLIGASCHSRESAAHAAEAGASYVLFGPVFATPSKARFGPPQGLSRLGEVCRETPIPVLAIGGITAENCSACMEEGAAGVAAIRLFQDASDFSAQVAHLRRLTS